jgi:hypothetical protein
MNVYIRECERRDRQRPPLTPGAMTQRRRASDRLLNELSKIGETNWPEAGYVIDSDETDYHVTHDYAFCCEHALIVARGDSILTGFAMFPVNVSGSVTDHEELCAFYGCDKPLNTGWPTDAWIDSALGLTETDPYACSVTPYELARSAANMTITDHRWPVWFRQARRVLRDARTS